MAVFHSCEYALLRLCQEDIRLWNHLKETLGSNSQKLAGSNYIESSSIASRRRRRFNYFLNKVLQVTENRLENFISIDGPCEEEETVFPLLSILGRYLQIENIAVMHLDNVFKGLSDRILSPEIFQCRNVEILSLKHNSLEILPVEIGRLIKLRKLVLTHNNLQIHCIPRSLIFCCVLNELYLDHNKLDALPGFLLDMKNLITVHRHGNHHSFKSTFLWYHTNINGRVVTTKGDKVTLRNHGFNEKPFPLKLLAAITVIQSETNFFEPHILPVTLQEYLSEIYNNFRICGFCRKVDIISTKGFKVFTFKYPYLGNTCVPFQHSACSLNCANSIEIPARIEQNISAENMDRKYNSYIQKFEPISYPVQRRKNHCIIS